MLKLQIIGNLGADAEVKAAKGGEFVTFRVAHSESYAGQTYLTWVDVTWNGNGGNLLQYLKKGAKVFVEGNATFRAFPSAKDKCWKAGASIFARTIELCGGSSELVPRELTTSDGEIVQVNKHYHTPAQVAWEKQIFDRNLNAYYVDANGFITPAGENVSPVDESEAGTNQ